MEKTINNDVEYLSPTEEKFIRKLLHSLSGKQNLIFDKNGIYMPIDFNDLPPYMLSLINKGVIQITSVIKDVSRLRILSDSDIFNSMKVASKLMDDDLFDRQHNYQCSRW